MNWFTKSRVGASSDAQKKSLVEEWGGCEHVSADHTKLFIVSYENDSFGREGYCLCEECYNKGIQVEDEEKHTCSDCRSTVAKKDGVVWKWYDFYAAQGDRPLFICNNCRTQEKHINRVEKDRRDYQEEMDHHNRQMSRYSNY